jgi:hypothetical protein
MAACSHAGSDGQCQGSGRLPADDGTLATWLPVLPALMPHDLRHGHQTWMEEAGTSDLLRSERIGHEVPGMRGVYGHVSPAMRAELKAMLEEPWESSLNDRIRPSPRSMIPALDVLLAAQREPATKIGSQNRTPPLPESEQTDQGHTAWPPVTALTCGFEWAVLGLNQ